MPPQFRATTPYSILRFIGAGGASAGIHLGTLYVLTTFFSIWYLAATTCGFLAACGINFFLQKYWVFETARTPPSPAEWFAFFTVATSNLAVNSLVLFTLVERTGMGVFPAQLLTSGLIAIESYLLYMSIFRTHSDHSDSATTTVI